MADAEGWAGVQAVDAGVREEVCLAHPAHFAKPDHESVMAQGRCLRERVAGPFMASCSSMISACSR